MWIAMFTSYYEGQKTETPMLTAEDPQEAIDRLKQILTEELTVPWVEVEEESLGRKILVRSHQRSKPAHPVVEYGWLYAAKLPTVGEEFRAAEIVEDATTYLR